MTDIEIKGPEDVLGIVKERTEKWFQIARKLSDFIKGLPLDQPTNDRLVKMMIEQVEEAELGAFIQGFKMGREFAEYEASHPEGAPEGCTNLLS